MAYDLSLFIHSEVRHRLSKKQRSLENIGEEECETAEEKEKAKSGS